MVMKNVENTHHTREEGKSLRPFETTEEMDEAIIKNWNNVVNAKDTVYHLGDVVINRRALPTIGRCNGAKHLIKGNHDVFRLEEYAKYFKDIHSSKAFQDFVCTHIPIHPASLERWGHNVHGHLHSYKVEYVDELGPDGDDPRYTCVSLEQINYTPISLEQLKVKIKEG